MTNNHFHGVMQIERSTPHRCCAHGGPYRWSYTDPHDNYEAALADANTCVAEDLAAESPGAIHEVHAWIVEVPNGDMPPRWPGGPTRCPLYHGINPDVSEDVTYPPAARDFLARMTCDSRPDFVVPVIGSGVGR
jgi:hypothetical protein